MNKVKMLNDFPELMKEWNYDKNIGIDPLKLTHGSGVRAHWICNKGHQWESVVRGRVRNNKKGCPKCSGYCPAHEGRNLLLSNPPFLKQWDYSKNINIKPEDLSPWSHKPVWWLCSVGHSWKAPPNGRQAGNGCSLCTNHISTLQYRIYSEIKYFIPNILLQEKVFGVECDIYLPDFSLAIEIDGSYWHKDKLDLDKKKNEILNKNNIILIRLRAEPLPMISKNDISYKEKGKFNNFDLELLIIKKLFAKIESIKNLNFKEYNGKESFINDDYFKKISNRILPSNKNSFTKTHPEIAKQWDYEKNIPLNPENFSYGSDKRVWWKCCKGHEWQADIKTKCLKNTKCYKCFQINRKNKGE